MKARKFQEILQKVSLLSGEDKLRLAFRLSRFTLALRKQGEIYGKKHSGVYSGGIA